MKVKKNGTCLRGLLRLWNGVTQLSIPVESAIGLVIVITPVAYGIELAKFPCFACCSPLSSATWTGYHRSSNI